MKNIIIKKGTILGVLLIGIFMISYTSNNYLDKPWWVTILRIIAFVSLIGYGLVVFRKQNKGLISLKESIILGLLIATVAGIYSAFFNYVFTTTIEPNYVNDLIEISNQEAILQNPTMSEEQKDTMHKINNGLMKPWVLSIFKFLSTVFYGVTISSILGLIFKKNNIKND